jgi:Helix-turn-helix domain
MLNEPEPSKYPMLEAILVIQKKPLQPMYSNSDLAGIFKTCVRSIQNWTSSGLLIPRNLPGRWKFLPQDIEDFLIASRKRVA